MDKQGTNKVYSLLYSFSTTAIRKRKSQGNFLLLRLQDE